MEDRHWFSRDVVVAIVGALATIILGYLTGLLEQVLKWLWAAGLGTVAFFQTTVKPFLLTDSHMPVWGLILVGIACVPPAYWWASRILQRRTKVPDPRRRYKQDTFDGIVWRWEYPLELALIKDWLKAFCRRCDTELVPIVDQHVPFPPNMGMTIFMCEHCNTQSKPHSGDHQVVRERVLREIERKIRTGEWLSPSSQSTQEFLAS